MRHEDQMDILWTKSSQSTGAELELGVKAPSGFAVHKISDRDYRSSARLFLTNEQINRPYWYYLFSF